MTTAIDEAKESITITTYILGTDEVGRAIVERLARRGSEGIEVRLLIDAVGSWRLRRSFLDPVDRGRSPGRLLHAGDPHPLPGTDQPAQPSKDRRHRRTVGAIIGGMNISGEYMGPSPDPEALA